MLDVFLETERLLLRRCTESDVDDLAALHGDPVVMRLLTGGTPTPRVVVENEIVPGILREYDRGRAGRWIAVERSTGSFLGWFALERSETCGVEDVELGYRLVASSWGSGYATEGSRALIRKGFTELGVRRVFARTMAVNAASRRVMEKSGLNYVRTFHQQWDDPIEGAEHGEVEYELLRDDWLRGTPDR